jgi:hypothetical protein
MKRADRLLALKAHRISTRKAITSVALAKKLRVFEDVAIHLANKGLMIERAEGKRLTEREMQVMTALARCEARAVALGIVLVKMNEVDFAAGQKSGWCASIANKRLRKARLEEGDDGLMRLGLLVITSNRNIWLTPAGWAFVWATGLITKNWKVPA